MAIAVLPARSGRSIVAPTMALLSRVRIRAYRSAGDVSLTLGPVTALVGEARSGKSNLLRAIWALLDPAAPIRPEDLRRDDVDTITVEADLVGGGRVSLVARPPDPPRAERAGAPPVLFLPAARAAARSSPLPRRAGGRGGDRPRVRGRARRASRA